jgi:hypothetical protein
MMGTATTPLMTAVQKSMAMGSIRVAANAAPRASQRRRYHRSQAHGWPETRDSCATRTPRRPHRRRIPQGRARRAIQCR